MGSVNIEYVPSCLCVKQLFFFDASRPYGTTTGHFAFSLVENSHLNKIPQLNQERQEEEYGCLSNCRGCCVMLRLNNDKNAYQIHFYCLNRIKLCDELKLKTKCNSWSTRGLVSSGGLVVVYGWSTGGLLVVYWWFTGRGLLVLVVFEIILLDETC
eukprot:scaffold105186_cov58-Attheya_sp.AAC.2